MIHILLWTNVRKYCSSDREKSLKIQGKRPFAKILRSLENFSEYGLLKVCKPLYLNISLENNAIQGGFVILQTSIFLFRFFPL